VSVEERTKTELQCQIMIRFIGKVRVDVCIPQSENAYTSQQIRIGPIIIVHSTITHENKMYHDIKFRQPF